MNTLNNLMPQTNNLDPTRDQVVQQVKQELQQNVNNPVTPVPCTGSSFQCDVSGSGKNPILDVSTTPSIYDKLASPLQEGSITGKAFQPNVILNWPNNSVATNYTRNSLRNTMGFENFQ